MENADAPVDIVDIYMKYLDEIPISRSISIKQLGKKFKYNPCRDFPIDKPPSVRPNKAPQTFSEPDSCGMLLIYAKADLQRMKSACAELECVINELESEVKLAEDRDCTLLDDLSPNRNIYHDTLTNMQADLLKVNMYSQKMEAIKIEFYNHVA